MKKSIVIGAIMLCIFSSCEDNQGNAANEHTSLENKNTEASSNSMEKPQIAAYEESKDYLVYDRVRLLDKMGFTEPQEAYSILLPKGWRI